MTEPQTRTASDEERDAIHALIQDIHAVYLNHANAGVPDWIIGNAMGIALCSFGIHCAVSLEQLTANLPLWYASAVDFDNDKEIGGRS